MKKLGLVGGMGPESTIPYYKEILYGVKERLGTDCFPELIIESVDVYKILGLCGERKDDELTDYLMNAINHLVAGGADFIALSSNTSHIVYDRLQQMTSVPLISIVEATCEEAVRRNIRKVGVIGTLFTMTGEFFLQPFQYNNIATIVPAKEEMNYINEKISSELEVGIVKEDTLCEFQKIIERMKQEEGIEAIILGCTELPLLLNDEVSPVPCLDTMKVHIQSLIEKIVE